GRGAAGAGCARPRARALPSALRGPGPRAGAVGAPARRSVPPDVRRGAAVQGRRPRDRSAGPGRPVARCTADGRRPLLARRRGAALGLNGLLELRDGYVPNEETARLFAEADAALLPYRSASQSGVAQLAFAYGRPVIATRVGGLPAAVADGEDGLLCEPDP